MYELAIDCNLDSVRQYKFMQDSFYFVLKKLKTSLLATGSAEHPRLCFFINSNYYVIEVVETFFSSLRDNVLNYARFYLGHLTSHFL